MVLFFGNQQQILHKCAAEIEVIRCSFTCFVVLIIRKARDANPKAIRRCELTELQKG